VMLRMVIGWVSMAAATLPDRRGIAPPPAGE
jgi:hypothetical protein